MDLRIKIVKFLLASLNMFVCKCGRDEALGVRVRGTSHNKRLPLTLDHVTSPKPGAEEVASGAF